MGWSLDFHMEFPYWLSRYVCDYLFLKVGLWNLFCGMEIMEHNSCIIISHSNRKWLLIQNRWHISVLWTPGSHIVTDLLNDNKGPACRFRIPSEVSSLELEGEQACLSVVSCGKFKTENWFETSVDVYG